MRPALLNLTYAHTHAPSHSQPPCCRRWSGLNCFTAKVASTDRFLIFWMSSNLFSFQRYWPKEKEKENLVVVFHTAGIRVVKPFTEVCHLLLFSCSLLAFFPLSRF